MLSSSVAIVILIVIILIAFNGRLYREELIILMLSTIRFAMFKISLYEPANPQLFLRFST